MTRTDQKKLGRKIREIRKELGLTMHQLASKVGVNYTTISRVETGKVSPSVVLLSDIAHYLGQSITSLLAQEPPRCRIIRSEDQPEIDSNKMALKLLVPRGVVDESFSISLGKGGPGEIVGLHETPGYEMAIIFKGRCIFRYGETDHELKSGDLVYFDGRVPHSVLAQEFLEFLAIYFRDKIELTSTI
jgi:transcriptional regulator with XRE-family HTH domain